MAGMEAVFRNPPIPHPPRQKINKRKKKEKIKRFFHFFYSNCGIEDGVNFHAPHSANLRTDAWHLREPPLHVVQISVHLAVVNTT